MTAAHGHITTCRGSPPVLADSAPLVPTNPRPRAVPGFYFPPGEGSGPRSTRKMKPEELITLIYDALYRLGFKGDCTGFFFLSYSAFLCATRPEDAPATPAWLYPIVAHYYHTDMQTVRAHIRTAITRAGGPEGTRSKQGWGPLSDASPPNGR